MQGTDTPETPATIAELPFFVGGRFPKPELIGRCHDHGIAWTSGRDLVEQVRDLSLGLSTLGMSRGSRVALIAESRPEWVLADLAVLAAGAVTVPIYPTLSTEQVAFILHDSEAELAIVSTAALTDKVAAAARDLPRLKTIVAMDATVEAPAHQHIDFPALADVAARGHRRILDGWGIGRVFHDAARATKSDDIATVIYTSGTTGDPKGVLLTHGNLVANIIGIRQALSLDDEDVALSCLPLAHAFERMAAYVYLVSGMSLVFAESIETVQRDLMVVRPTVMTGVPRLFEKMQARVLSRGRQSPGLQSIAFEWAMRVADARAGVLTDGRELPWWLRVESWVAERLVFGAIRNRLGGRLRFAVSGGAPLHPEVVRFFLGLGLPLLEGYGLTETSPVVTVMPLTAIRLGTVGRPLPNVEIRIADDGEILVRGPSVTKGYHNRPAETAAAQTDGWLRTGDLGSIDSAGYLRITGRKKDLIVTSGGKKIAPQPIETALKKHPLVAEAILVGEQRNFLSALIVPQFDELCRRLKAIPPRDVAEAQAFVERADVRVMYQAVVDATNAPLAPYERIKEFVILPQEFSSETGELTPTLKVKRRAIAERYGQIIDDLYEKSATKSSSLAARYE